MSNAWRGEHGRRIWGVLVLAILAPSACSRSRGVGGVSSSARASSQVTNSEVENHALPQVAKDTREPVDEVEPQPGVVTAVDSQTVHMLLPQPDIRVDPDEASVAPTTLPQGMLGVHGEDVLGYVKAAAGKGTLVNVWASWCGACKVEMPLFQRLREQYQHRGISVLFVSVDEPSAAPAALRILQAQKIEGPALVAQGSLGYFKLALSPIWKGSLPATFLYDATGKLRYYWGTQVYEDEVKNILDDFLAGKAVDGMANLSIMAPP